VSSYSAEGFTLTAWGDPTAGEPVVPDDPSPIRGEHGTPEAFIQWKGTEVCLDFYCPCGMQSHYDGGFAYALECQSCGRVFDMPHTVQLRERPVTTETRA
jgi:hypothetical protein